MKNLIFTAFILGGGLFFAACSKVSFTLKQNDFNVGLNSIGHEKLKFFQDGIYCLQLKEQDLIIDSFTQIKRVTQSDGAFEKSQQIVQSLAIVFLDEERVVLLSRGEDTWELLSEFELTTQKFNPYSKYIARGYYTFQSYNCFSMHLDIGKEQSINVTCILQNETIQLTQVNFFSEFDDRNKNISFVNALSFTPTFRFLPNSTDLSNGKVTEQLFTFNDSLRIKTYHEDEAPPAYKPVRRDSLFQNIKAIKKFGLVQTAFTIVQDSVDSTTVSYKHQVNKQFEEFKHKKRFSKLKIKLPSGIKEVMFSHDNNTFDKNLAGKFQSADDSLFRIIVEKRAIKVKTIYEAENETSIKSQHVTLYMRDTMFIYTSKSLTTNPKILIPFKYNGILIKKIERNIGKDANNNSCWVRRYYTADNNFIEERESNIQTW